MKSKNSISYRKVLINSIIAMFLMFILFPSYDFANTSIITKHPDTLYVEENKEAVFKVEATGENLTYEWIYKTSDDDFTWERVPDTMAEGVATNTLTIPSASIDYQGYSFRCRVTGSNMELSNIVYLHITSDALSKNVALKGITAPENFVASGTIEGSVTLTFDNPESGSRIVLEVLNENDEWVTISNDATSPVIRTGLEKNKEYNYRIYAVDINGVKSAYVYDTAYTSDTDYLYIMKHPENISVNENVEAIFNIETSGDNLTYKWLYKAPIDNFTWEEVPETMAEGINTNTLKLRNTLLDYEGYAFRCKVIGEREELSSAAYLYVIDKDINVKVEIQEEKGTSLITEWKILSNNTEIKLPVTGLVDITINWGDGTTQKVSGDITASNLPTHNYTKAGTYEVKVKGTLDVWGTTEEYEDGIVLDNYYSYANYLIGVKQWGELNASKYSFAYCENLSEVSNEYTENTFNNVTDMSNMFAYCRALETLDLSNINAVKVTDMSNMFAYSSIRSVNLTNFNTDSVTNMSNMFAYCTSLSSLDLSSFNTSKVTNMEGMFNECSLLSSVNLNSFNTINVTSMSNMFAYCTSLVNLDLSSFITPKLITMNNMFYSCEDLINLDLTNFDTSNITNMSNVFAYCIVLKELDLSNFNTSKVSDMSSMFYECNSLESINVSHFDTKSVTDMNAMFFGNHSLKYLDLSNFDTEKVTDMSEMFNGTSSLKSILVSNEFVVLGNAVNMFTVESNVSTIISVSETPNENQFGNIAEQVQNITFYVPNSSVEAYKNVWSEGLNIKPILEMVGPSEIQLYVGEEYTEQGYKVAGYTESNSGDYIVYGYNAYLDGSVDKNVAATYEISYELLRYLAGEASSVATETRTVEVVASYLTPPSNFEATDGLSDTKIVVTFDNSLNESLKYELWVRSLNTDWILLTDDVASGYVHSDLNKNTSYEYRIRTYDEEGMYSEYVYTTGSTIIQTPSDDVLLDTIEPEIVDIVINPDIEYGKANDKVEITFTITDENYYESYNLLTKQDVIIKIGDNVLTTTDTTLEKTSIVSGEKIKFTINKVPYQVESGILSIVIPEGKIKDKALNGNLESIIETGILIVNSNITNTPPTLDLDTFSNDVTITCNQTTDFMSDNVEITYEYRKAGETEFTKADSNVLTNLAENTTYEVRTVLKDITGNEVVSEIATITTIYLDIKVKFNVLSPESGNYVAGTNVEIIAEFNVSTRMENVPVLTIKFGSGDNITLNGTFESENKRIVYNYTITMDDLGKLTPVNFNGSVVYAENTLEEYNMVPEFTGSEIYARTGAKLNIAGEEGRYYPYIQDAINAADENKEATVILIRDEELLDTILVDNTKNIVLDLNGKDIAIRRENATAILNDGTLKIIEEVGTGEIISTGINTTKAIINNGKLDIVGGTIYANLENGTFGASAISNNGTLTIGEDDGNIETSVPSINSVEFGIQNLGTGTTYFNDGVIEGARNKSYEGVLNIPTGYDVITERIENNREKTYLGIDKVPPTLSYTILTNGWRNDFIEVEVTATDAETGVRLVTVDNDEVLLTDSKAIVKLTENKEYILYAEDNASNSASTSFTINTIDIIPPKIIRISASETEEDGIIDAVIETQDLESGLAGVIVKEVDEMPTDDEEWIIFDTYPISKQYVTVKLSKNKVYYCFAKDRAGNITRHNEELEFKFLDPNAPIIERVEIVKDAGKDYVSGKTVIVDVKARDNIGVTEILISDVDLTADEAKLSNDWQVYNEQIIHKLPVEGDKVYTIYVWVKDAMGNISIRQTASAELKSLVVGDNELDYTGSDRVYNKSSLRFLVKDYHFDFDNSITEENIILRLTNGDKVLRNITTGLKVNKISDYDGVRQNDFEYVGEIYELEMENLPGTGKLNLVLLGGTYEDLARNKVITEVRATDMFVDNNPPEITVNNTNEYVNGFEVKDITVMDAEGYLITSIEVNTNGVIETHNLRNGNVKIPLADGAIITAYDKAGNEGVYEVGNAQKAVFTVNNYDIKLQYAGSVATVNYVYEGDGALEVLSSDTEIANVSIDTNTKTLTISPVNAGYAEITLRALKTEKYVQDKLTIRVEVTPLPVSLEWSANEFNYNTRTQKVEATVKNVVLGDTVVVDRYRNNNKVNAGQYVAEALSVNNSNYTVVNGTTITHNWKINKINRTITLGQTSLEIEMPRTGTITFQYTGESADAEVIVSNSNIITAKVNNYENSGDIIVSSEGIGKANLTLVIPESTNYNRAEVSMGENSIEVIHKVWLIYDSRGGTELTGKWVVYGRAYGELATPQKEGDKFAGWFTEPEGKGARVTADTIVPHMDKHTIYACWNQPPEFVSCTISNKAVNSVTVAVKASDPDEDNIRYRIFLGGTLRKDSGYIAHNETYSFTVTGLKEYTNYEYYVVVDDGYEETIGSILQIKTLCSGSGVSCTATYCQGYIDKTKTCTTCDGDGYTSYTCDDGSRSKCSTCGGDGEVSKSCSGGSSKNCSVCNGSGRCKGTFRKDSESRKGSCPDDCGTQSDVIVTEYSCSSCGATKTVERCPACGASGTSGGSHYSCSNCGGDGTIVSACSHGYTSSHTVTSICSSCDDGYDYNYCEHGNYKSHTVKEECWNCDGSGEEDYKYTPCSHGNSSAHYYCTKHEYNGSSSTHTHCVHDKMVIHE